MAHRLFCYGTLESVDTMRGLIGTVPPSSRATLKGYGRYRIKGAYYPGIVALGGANVDGTLYRKITPSQLRQLDRYEGVGYRRHRVAVYVDGTAVTAWTYVVRRRYRATVSRRLWQREYMRLYSRKGCGGRPRLTAPGAGTRQIGEFA